MQRHVLGRANIGGEHALFDQTVRVVARRRHDPNDLAVLVEFERQLVGIEIDRAACLARCQQHAKQGVKVLQMWQQRFRFR